MGSAHLDREHKLLSIVARVILYGNAANVELGDRVAADVENYWNAPHAQVKIDDDWCQVKFSITGSYAEDLIETTVYENDDPRNNYFRVEEFANGNISFVDDVNCNTGYFKLDNLLNNSSTAAHEFGHTIGLEHPQILDIRGSGTPGIMYPRGIIVSPFFQYDPHTKPLAPGGTMDPFKRKVLLNDIANLQLATLRFNAAGFAVLGAFTSIWHDAHQP